MESRDGAEARPGAIALMLLVGVGAMLADPQRTPSKTGRCVGKHPAQGRMQCSRSPLLQPRASFASPNLALLQSHSPPLSAPPQHLDMASEPTKAEIQKFFKRLLSKAENKVGVVCCC